MSPDFLQNLLRQHAPAQAAGVRAVRPRPLDGSASILANLTAGRTAQPVGLFGLEAELRTGWCWPRRRAYPGCGPTPTRWSISWPATR